jgi:hypothetical protein
MALFRHGLYTMALASPRRRARKLLQFAEIEADGGRDLVRAAEFTQDPSLRRKFLVHARDEERHAAMFRARGLALRQSLAGGRMGNLPNWLPPGERGLDDLRVERESESALLAFLHLSEKNAARDFAIYRDVLGRDPQTRAVFERILRDEEAHMKYTLAELNRVSPDRRARYLWNARLRRLWKSYLRLASGLASLIAKMLLTVQYFILLPPFALLAKRAARRETPGWVPIDPQRQNDPHSQY